MYNFIYQMKKEKNDSKKENSISYNNAFLNDSCKETQIESKKHNISL